MEIAHNGPELTGTSSRTGSEKHGLEFDCGASRSGRIGGSGRRACHGAFDALPILRSTGTRHRMALGSRRPARSR